MPASTSSNTITGTVEANTVFKPNITREISPPEAMFLSGRKAWPGLGENKNSTLSAPVGPKFSSSISTQARKRTALNPSGRICSVKSADNFSAASKRLSCNSSANFKRTLRSFSNSSRRACSASSLCSSACRRAFKSAAVFNTSCRVGPYLPLSRLSFSWRASISSSVWGSMLMSSL